jgi:membrane protein required for beta-lactamase induction
VQLVGIAGNWSNQTNAAYLTWGRLLFVFAVAMIIVLGMSKNGGVVYGFMNLPLWELVTISCNHV